MRPFVADILSRSIEANRSFSDASRKHLQCVPSTLFGHHGCEGTGKGQGLAKPKGSNGRSIQDELHGGKEYVQRPSSLNLNILRSFAGSSGANAQGFMLQERIPLPRHSVISYTRASRLQNSWVVGLETHYEACTIYRRYNRPAYVK